MPFQLETEQAVIWNNSHNVRMWKVVETEDNPIKGSSSSNLLPWFPVSEKGLDWLETTTWEKKRLNCGSNLPRTRTRHHQGWWQLMTLDHIVCGWRLGMKHGKHVNRFGLNPPTLTTARSVGSVIRWADGIWVWFDYPIRSRQRRCGHADALWWWAFTSLNNKVVNFRCPWRFCNGFCGGILILQIW